MPRTSLLLGTIALAACGQRTPPPAAATPPDAMPSPPDAIDAPVSVAAPTPPPVELADVLEAYAADRGVTDACLVVRSPDGTIRQSDAVRCAERLSPASTFKLPNALVGADLGLLDSPESMMKYDARRYPRQTHWPDAWAHDQTLRDALEVSAVPLFRRLAVQIGERRMQAHLDAMAYGNRSMAGGLDRFWLTGGLAISAPEQIDFLTRLSAGTLPVSARAHEIVREAMPWEATEVRKLRWKTGTTARDDAPGVAWYVGWVDGPEGAHQFACWIRQPAGDVERLRSNRDYICRRVLDGLALFPSLPMSGN